MTALEAYKELMNLRDKWDGFHGELIPKEAILVAIKVLKQTAANDIQQLANDLRYCGSGVGCSSKCSRYSEYHDCNLTCGDLETDAADVIERLMKEAGYFEDHNPG